MASRRYDLRTIQCHEHIGEGKQGDQDGNNGDGEADGMA